MDALLVRDLADRNKIERKKHRVLKGKGQATNKKVRGNSGEVHYFEHESGQVAGVKFFSVNL